MGLLIEVGQQKKLVLLVVSCCIQMMQKIPLRQKQSMSIILLLFIYSLTKHAAYFLFVQS